MENINAKEFDRSPTLDELVKSDNDLKNFLVQYVGEKNNPEDSNVTVEMIVETMAEDFPEFVLVIFLYIYFYHLGCNYMCPNELYTSGPPLFAHHDHFGWP